MKEAENPLRSVHVEQSSEGSSAHLLGDRALASTQRLVLRLGSRWISRGNSATEDVIRIRATATDRSSASGGIGTGRALVIFLGFASDDHDGQRHQKTCLFHYDPFVVDCFPCIAHVAVHCGQTRPSALILNRVITGRGKGEFVMRDARYVTKEEHHCEP
jgi:hypothetical protein